MKLVSTAAKWKVFWYWGVTGSPVHSELETAFEFVGHGLAGWLPHAWRKDLVIGCSLLALQILLARLSLSLSSWFAPLKTGHSIVFAKHWITRVVLCFERNRIQINVFLFFLDGTYRFYNFGSFIQSCLLLRLSNSMGLIHRSGIKDCLDHSFL